MPYYILLPLTRKIEDEGPPPEELKQPKDAESSADRKAQKRHHGGNDARDTVPALLGPQGKTGYPSEHKQNGRQDRDDPAVEKQVRSEGFLLCGPRAKEVSEACSGYRQTDAEKGRLQPGKNKERCSDSLCSPP